MTVFFDCHLYPIGGTGSNQDNVNKNKKVQADKVNEVHDLEDELDQFHNLAKVYLLRNEDVVFNHINPFELVIQ